MALVVLGSLLHSQTAIITASVKEQGAAARATAVTSVAVAAVAGANHDNRTTQPNDREDSVATAKHAALAVCENISDLRNNRSEV